MTMLPPPSHPDEHLMRARTERKLQDAQDAKGNRRSRSVSVGDMVLVSVLALAALAIVALAVLVLF